VNHQYDQVSYCRELSLSKPQLLRWKIVCVYIYINDYRKLNNSLCFHIFT
jgi:hypothetical protein